MFYAEISIELKQLAMDVTRNFLESGNASESEKLLVTLAPYLIGFVGVHVDFPQGDFHRGLDERKWYLSDISDLGYLFEGEDTDKAQDRALFIPAGKMGPLRFMFRDEKGFPLSQERGSRGAMAAPRSGGSRRSSPVGPGPVEDPEDGGSEVGDKIRPGMFRDGEDVT